MRKRKSMMKVGLLTLIIVCVLSMLVACGSTKLPFNKAEGIEQHTQLLGATIVQDEQSSLHSEKALSGLSTAPRAEEAAIPIIRATAASLSMDEVDKIDFAPGPSPVESLIPVPIVLQAGASEIHAQEPQTLSLDGHWEMIEGGIESQRVELPRVMADTEVAPAANAINGNPADAWVSDNSATAHWLKVDLSEVVNINKIVVRHSENAQEVTSDFTISGSLDGMQWTQLAALAGNTSSVNEIDLAPTTYRYFRLHVTKANSGQDNVARIYEFEIVQETSLLTALPGVTVSADSIYGNFTPEKVIDGRWAVEDTDEWVSNGDTPIHWIAIDLQQPYLVNKIVIRHSDDLRTVDFQIQGSQNGLNWTDLDEVLGNALLTTEHPFELAVEYRYFRLYITKPGPWDNHARIYEFEVWGDQTYQKNYSQQALSEASWFGSMPAQVPGSVHTALLENEVIPDPYVGFNDRIARQQSYKTWWFKKTFTRPQGMVHEKLVFDGVADSMTVWLNGQLLGSHQGMFGGPTFNIADALIDGENTLIVRLDPAKPWDQTVVFNNSYGWHYLDLPPLGIWRPVAIKGEPSVAVEHPFVATMDTNQGTLRLHASLKSTAPGWSGKLTAVIEPDNFEGSSYHFLYEMQSGQAEQEILLEFDVPDSQLWWPLDHGDPNLYRLKLSFTPDGGGIADYKETTFGIRTIEMHPLPDGPVPNLYNWTFVINGKPIFAKGANWATIDVLMRFDRERYDRFLSMAHNAHINLLRAWGSGMPETDEFYDLADRYGIMVLQEWPTAWDSDKRQPQDLLEETVRLNTLRIRNHPSLVMYGGGNESADPSGPMIRMMGRYAYELDGTRPFHRSGPWGGSFHNYDVYWGGQPLDRNLHMKQPFIGEFGLASVPNYESVLRYLPDEEKQVWPAPDDGSFAHKTPTFNTIRGYGFDMQLLSQYSGMFTPNNSLQDFVVGSQVAQATGVRHTLELARVSWPESTGIAYYKLTDNNPAASWATVDWYGVPKMSHFVIQDAYAPLAAPVIFSELNPGRKAVELPVYLLDDADQLSGSSWKVTVRAYNADLDEMKREEFVGSGSIDQVESLGNLALTADQVGHTPVLIVSEVSRNSMVEQRSFYWMNYEHYQGSLFYMLPFTELTVTEEEGDLVVSNVGDKPAVAVQFAVEGISDQFIADDNFFWLDAGESRVIRANRTEGVGVKAWNSAAIPDSTPPAAITNLDADSVSASEVRLSWEPANDSESGIRSYFIIRNGVKVATLPASAAAYSDKELAEDTAYTYKVIANNGVMLGTESQPITVTTLPDTVKPLIASLDAGKSGKITIVFDESVEKTSAENVAHYAIEQGGLISSATLLADGRTVVLDVSAMTAGASYTLKVNGVRDIANVPNIAQTQVPFTSRLVGNWKLEEDTPGKDSSGFGGHGMVNGGQSVSGVVGQAMAFTDSSHYIEVPNSNLNIGSEFTISGWIQTPQADGFRVLLSKGPKLAGHFEIYLNPTGWLAFYAEGIGDFNSNVKLDDNQWHHFAVIYSGEHIKFYVDGILRSTHNASGGVADTIHTFRINGLVGGTFPMPGKMDEIRIYTYALSASMVADLAIAEEDAFLESVAVEVSSDTLQVGETAQANLIGYMNNRSEANLEGASIQYGSYYPSVATVSDSGLITAITPGITVIQAAITWNGITLQAMLPIQVKGPTTPSGGNGSGGYIPVTPVATPGQLKLAAGDGGIVTIAGSVVAIIPKGATNRDMHMAIEAVEQTGDLIGTNDILLSAVYKLSSSIPEVFLKPVTIMMVFDSSKLAVNQRPALHYYDEQKKGWVEIVGTVNGNAILARMDAFAKVAVFAVHVQSDVSTESPENTDLDSNTSTDMVTDIKGHWAEKALNKALASGIVKGYPDHTLKPDHYATRAEFVVLLVRALGLESGAGDTAFNDQVQIPIWAKQALNEAVKAGLIRGFGDGSFRPNASITRAELVAIIVRASGMRVDPDAKLTFQDTKDIPLWVVPYIATAVEAGLVDGVGYNRFAPQRFATRAEAITLILELLEHSND